MNLVLLVTVRSYSATAAYALASTYDLELCAFNTQQQQNNPTFAHHTKVPSESTECT